MAVNVIKRTWLQDRMVRPETLNGMAFQAEAGAHRFEITGYDSNGNKMAFSGTVTAIFLRPDNTDVPLTGVISNGVAQVTLSQECYQVPGRFGLAIFVNSGNTKTVVYKCIGPVGMTSSGVAASSVVQSVSTLIDRIEAAVNSIPQDYSALNKAVSATCPEMRNGSTGNPGNANSITTKYIIKIDKSCDELILEYIGNTQAKYYIFGYSVFKGVADGTESIVARTTAASFLDYPEKYVQTEPYVIIPVSQLGDYTHIAFVLWAKSDETTNIPLRIATDQNNLRVTFRHASSMGHEEINNRSVKVGVQNASKMASPLKLVHFSDLHRDVNALNRIRASVKYVCPNADNVICTGDIVADTYAEITSWWIPEFMTCIGNHDTASYNGAYNWTALTMAQRDEMYISPFEAYWGIVHTAGTSYYYKDYPAAHIRLIVMDAMLYSGTPGAEATAQTEWLANLLASAITDSLHVIIAIHAPHGGSVPVACSFTKLGQENMYVNVDCNTPDVVINTVATAIGNGLHFIGYICGHTHQDAIWDCTGDRSQLMYNITCAAVDQTAQWENSDQYRSDELDAFNVLTIDTASTTIKILRGGGANTDVALRPRVSMVINYSTGKIITDTYASGTQDAVVYGEAQDLTDEQTAQARANIGAGSAADVSENTADITANANEITSLKSDFADITGNARIDFIKGKYIATNGETADITALVTSPTYAYAVVDCEPGDTFTITGTGGGTPRLYAFLGPDSNGVRQIISKSASALVVTNLVITAPQGAEKLVLNVNYSFAYMAVTGKLIRSTWDSIAVNAKDIANVQKTLTFPNLTNPDDYTLGYYKTPTGATGRNATYDYTGRVAVTPGETIYFTIRARYVCAMDADGGVIVSAGVDASVIDSYLVPEGVAFIQVTFYAEDINGFMATRIQGREFIEYGTPVISKDALPDDYERKPKLNYYSEKGNLSADEYLWIDKLMPIKNLSVVQFSGNIVGEFAGVEIGYTNDPTQDNVSHFKLDATKYYRVTDNPTEDEHSLTMSGNMAITITQTYTHLFVDVTCNGGKFHASSGWAPQNKGVYVKALSAMTDCVISITASKNKKNIVVFGDSYVSYGESRWPYYLVEAEYDKNVTVIGYSGENSENGYRNFTDFMPISDARYVVWAYGMNDHDTASAENASWRENIDKVIAYCEKNNIIPVLCTIPNVPRYSNAYKNAYVRSFAGKYPIIDFAKAVGSDVSSAWYAGMLSSDNIHPTAVGAMALYNRAIADFPQLCVDN